ncbi:hypothetical protein R3P38DRAFT_3220591 [Favolaschia claudopus]|uniref:Uncharacterized protein n=1 Tax=Favolaschia claudopus TaxID=2862362 RepID=A0AAW0A1G3_9AGAR
MSPLTLLPRCPTTSQLVTPNAAVITFNTVVSTAVASTAVVDVAFNPIVATSWSAGSVVSISDGGGGPPAVLTTAMEKTCGYRANEAYIASMGNGDAGGGNRWMEEVESDDEWFSLRYKVNGGDGDGDDNDDGRRPTAQDHLVHHFKHIVGAFEDEKSEVDEIGGFGRRRKVRRRRPSTAAQNVAALSRRGGNEAEAHLKGWWVIARP